MQSDSEPENEVIQPPVDPPADNPGRLTNQLRFLKEIVLETLWAHPLAWPFYQPVDAKKLNLPDYHSIIQYPMDMGTIRKRLDNNYYWCASDCIEDFIRMFDNCYLYNNPDEAICRMAESLQNLLWTEIDDMPENEYVIDIPEGGGARKLDITESDKVLKNKPHEHVSESLAKLCLVEAADMPEEDHDIKDTEGARKRDKVLKTKPHEHVSESLVRWCLTEAACMPEDDHDINDKKDAHKLDKVLKTKPREHVSESLARWCLTEAACMPEDDHDIKDKKGAHKLDKVLKTKPCEHVSESLARWCLTEAACMPEDDHDIKDKKGARKFDKVLNTKPHEHVYESLARRRLTEAAYMPEEDHELNDKKEEVPIDISNTPPLLNEVCLNNGSKVRLKNAKEEKSEDFNAEFSQGIAIGAEIGYYLGVANSYLVIYKDAKKIKHLKRLKSLITSFSKQAHDTNVLDEIRTKFKIVCELLKIDICTFDKNAFSSK